MAVTWTFGRKLGAGMALTVAFGVLSGGIAVYALRTVVASKDQVVAVNAQNLIDAQRLLAARALKGLRGHRFVLTRAESDVDTLRAARAEFLSTLERLKAQVQSD